MRTALFNVYDRLSGGLVKAHLSEINLMMNEPSVGLDSNEWRALRKHAVTSCPFYSNYQSTESLEEFPVIDKAIIKENLSSFLAKGNEPSALIAMTTSGSTGTPFTVYQDKRKARNHADTWYFGQLGGYQLGNRLLYLKIWARQKMRSSLSYYLQNIKPVDVLNLNDNAIANLLKDINAHRNETHNALGYVSALEQIVRYCEKENIKEIGTSFAGVITMSEGLSEVTKQKLATLFDCHVLSRYSNLENGIIAQQLPQSGNRFLINSASYIVEILHPKKNEVVPDGQLGRIVVTDLYNNAMPMIRYDTGDFGVKQKGDDGFGYLTSVEGRKLDLLYNTKGEIVSSYIMYKNMWQYTEITQYQLIQTGAKSYLFKINSPSGFRREDQLVREFVSYLGDDAEFRIEYVSEIPLLDSGKRRKTVNLYRPN